MPQSNPPRHGEPQTAKIDRGQLDRRRNAVRADLADASLRDSVKAERFVEGEERQVIQAAIPLRSTPNLRSAFDTQLLFGEHVHEFDSREGWSWVQAKRDRYVGYLPSAVLSKHVQTATHWVRALGTFVYPVADIKSPPLMHLSIGAELTVAEIGDPFSRLVKGGYVVTRHITDIGRHHRDFVEIAERFIGTPYLWGGRTRIGIDCSGLLQISLQSAGIPAPRDSDMQCAELGEDLPIPPDLQGLKRGDLVFWKGHVGIMTDGLMLLHANAHHMSVAIETLPEAVERISKAGSRIIAIRRFQEPTVQRRS